jgi:NADH-ubiquinone oxidoreductase chain 5
LIGISSYLLINFWYTRIQANKSGIKALTVNRVGDMFLSVGFFAIIWVFGNVDYATVFSVAPFINESAITIIGLLLFVGAMAKSAQIGLHTWLPDAMEGPTPVSALIHAATLVTAGVYLMLRSSPIIEYGPTVLIVITWVGALTAFFAATTGLLQNDLKRVIAYSTCSQMGYLFIAVGLSQYNVALFHLVNHAFFKALLFLAAGAVIHGMADQQDLRRLGGLVNFLPFTYTAILIGSLSLIAFPFLTGFYSKDLIIESGAAQFALSGYLVYWLGSISAGITRFYSFRLISLTFFTTPSAPKGDYLHRHEAPIIIVIPLVILSIMSIVFGYIAKDAFVGPGSDFFANALFQHPDHITLIDAEFALASSVKLLPMILSFMGAAASVYMYHVTPNFAISLTNNTIGRRLYTFFNGKWLFDIVYNKYIISGSLQLGHIISKVLDRGIIEMVGPYGLTNTLTGTARSISSYDTGVITSYALYIILGLMSFIFLLFAPLLVNVDPALNISLVIVYIFTVILLRETKSTNTPNMRMLFVRVLKTSNYIGHI